MSHTPIGGDYTLDARQLQLTRGVVNAGIEYAIRFDNPITPAFDSTRLPHLESAHDVLSAAFEQVTPDGSWTGRMTPSEMQATRMAVGWVEDELTPPRSGGLDDLPINPRPGEIERLDEVLDGLVAPTVEDVAHSDWKIGVNTDAIGGVIGQFDLVLEQIRSVASRTNLRTPPMDRVERAFEFHQEDVSDCEAITPAIVQLSTAAGAAPRRDVVTAGSDLIDSITGTDCFYSEFHRASLRAAWGRYQQAVEVGDALDRELAALDVATAWFWSRARQKVASI